MVDQDERFTEFDERRALLAAVNGLREGVEALNKTLKEDYPKRSEINRARKTYAILVVLGLFVSSLVTISVISTCFLSKAAVDGRAPGACHAMPGFAAAEERNHRAYKRFIELGKLIEQNQRDIIRLKRHR